MCGTKNNCIYLVFLHDVVVILCRRPPTWLSLHGKNQSNAAYLPLVLQKEIQAMYASHLLKEKKKNAFKFKQKEKKK